jgi:cell division protease FtsH
MGHALVAMALPGGDTIHKVSIIPRGIGSLGYTIQRPTEDRFLMTREELENKMAVLLGGRAAEQLVFGSITTGASDDLRRVADIAHAMIHDYAMGTGTGSLRVTPQEISDSTRRLRDDEARELADEAFRNALSIIDRHREKLDELAATLLANEVLERGDIDRIMAEVPRVAPPRLAGGEVGIAAATAVSPAPPPPRRR